MSGAPRPHAHGRTHRHTNTTRLFTGCRGRHGTAKCKGAFARSTRRGRPHVPGERRLRRAAGGGRRRVGTGLRAGRWSPGWRTRPRPRAGWKCPWRIGAGCSRSLLAGRFRGRGRAVRFHGRVGNTRRCVARHPCRRLLNVRQQPRAQSSNAKPVRSRSSSAACGASTLPPHRAERQLSRRSNADAAVLWPRPPCIVRWG